MVQRDARAVVGDDGAVDPLSARLHQGAGDAELTEHGEPLGAGASGEYRLKRRRHGGPAAAQVEDALEIAGNLRERHDVEAADGLKRPEEQVGCQRRQEDPLSVGARVRAPVGGRHYRARRGEGRLAVDLGKGGAHERRAGVQTGDDGRLDAA
jgi:hypothetical protein